MQFSPCAPAGGFAAFAAQPVETAWDHGPWTHELAQEPTQRGEGTADLLAEFGEI